MRQGEQGTVYHQRRRVKNKEGALPKSCQQLKLIKEKT